MDLGHVRLSRWGMAILLMGILAVAGCARGTSPHSASSMHTRTDTTARPANTVEKTLRAAAARWAGTPHRLGGLDRRGIDCSGLVQRVFKESFGLVLPRATVLQVRTGRPIARGRWQPGDLVFFKPPSWKGRHVGIFLGGNEFLHASTSAGVTVSHLDSAYWRKSYWTTRRVLTGR